MTSNVSVSRHGHYGVCKEIGMRGENRRVVMTCRMIKDALIDLMNDNDFSKISISDVCKAADVNRSTFYSHYKDTKEVLSEIEDDIIARLPDVDDSKNDLKEAMRSILSFIKENSELITIMVVRRRDDSFVEKLLSTVLARYEHLSPAISEVRTRYNYIFCTSGIIGIIKEWISSDFELSLDAFTDIALALAVKVTT